MGRETIFWLVGAVGSGIWCAIAVYWWRKAVDYRKEAQDLRDQHWEEHGKWT